ncbi:hypothetical protein VPNG_09830 [Cytospora leucostoma]|uniref:Extracellular membrane protein CFEM domain-containing protein n=1 Tax=Cytospora leucostoma TaxID=1230097 RepID=A0A423VMB8_9PEZI|nr:hypothetical protein VPNG_09830 [Cytospora leucostoma]
MKYFIVAAAFSAVSYAQQDVAPVADCSNLFNKCLGLPNVDVPECNIGQAQCNQCQSDYVACQTPVDGAPINQDACNAQLQGCVSTAFPPFQAFQEYQPPPAAPVITTPVAPAAPSITKAAAYARCQSVYYQCLTAGGKQQLCLCGLSTCIGEGTDDSRKSCSSLSVAATATSTPMEFYGSKATGSPLKELAGEVNRESTTPTKNAGAGIATSSSWSLMGLAAALVGPLIV